MAGHQGSSTRRQFAEQLAGAIEAERRDMHVTLRGRIVSYDKDKQYATIKPLLKGKFGDKDLDAPELLEVPVRQPRGGGYAVHMDVKKGDEVDLVVYSRSHEDYQVEGKEDSPSPRRMNDLSDAVAFPAGSSEKTAMKKLPAGRAHFGSDADDSGFQVGEGGSLHMRIKGGDKFSLDKEGKTYTVEGLEKIILKVAGACVTISNGRVDVTSGGGNAPNRVMTEAGPSTILWAE